RRLRLKAMCGAGSASKSAASKLIVEVRSADGRPLAAPLFIGRLALALDGTVIDVAPVAAGADAIGATGSLVLGGSAWGGRGEQAGRPSREFRNFGSVFHKVSALFDVTGVTDVAALSVIVDAWCAEPCAVEIAIFGDAGERRLGVHDIPARRWTTVAAHAGDRERRAAPRRTTAVGSGAIVVTSLPAGGAADQPAVTYSPRG